MPGPESRKRAASKGALIRYTLIQVPGILFLGAGLYILLDWGWISRSTAAWVMGLWLAKDVALYPFYRPALQGSREASRALSLDGAIGLTHSEIAETGIVVVRGEYWRARTDGQPIPPHTEIEVISQNRRILLVRPHRG